MAATLVLPLIGRSETPTPHLSPDAAHARTLRVLMLLAGVAILNVVDLMYSVFAQHVGMLNEMNPLAAVFLQQGMMGSFISFKLLLVTCGLGMLWKLRSNRLALPGCWVLLLAYTYMGVVWYQWVCVINSMYEVRLATGVR